MGVPEKGIVLDANILIRAVLGNKVRDLLESYQNSVDFVTADICFDSGYQYIPQILNKRNIPLKDAQDTLKLISLYVRNIDEKQYNIHEQKAKLRIEKRDIEDWPIVATALFLDYPIWTEDNDFFGSGIATWTSDRVYIYLYIYLSSYID